MISDYNKKIRNLEEEKLSKDNELNKVRILEKHINYIKESYRNKKKIKAFLVNKMLPEFNNYLDYYQEFFEVANKIHFDEFLCPKMDKWDFVTSSGGECQRIDLSIMFALSDMHIASAGPQSNFMMLDEVDGSLDPFTMNRLSSLLSDDFINRDDLSNIFIISHRREMKDRFPNTIKVKYKQERSYIING
jgi:DNA repair exonuclease SbcCD ATPase subunit